VKGKTFKCISKILLFLRINYIFGVETILREIYCVILTLDLGLCNGLCRFPWRRKYILNVGMLTFSRLISHAYILLSLALVEVHS
jgi:hypothetical protein